jgi:hypothetical protein
MIEDDNDDLGQLDWAIVGGEIGANARSMDLTWAEGIEEQCRKEGVRARVGMSPALNGESSTHLGAKGKYAGNINQWPGDIGALCIRKLPEVDPDVDVTESKKPS